MHFVPGLIADPVAGVWADKIEAIKPSEIHLTAFIATDSSPMRSTNSRVHREFKEAQPTDVQSQRFIRQRYPEARLYQAGQ